MNVHFVSLGCPKNRVDTEVMLGHTADAGHQLVAAPEAAEVIVVNTCGFIGEAKQESIDAILEMAKYKESGSCKRLVVAGCLSQRYPKELSSEMPEVDQFIGTDEVGAIAKAISGTINRLSVVDTPAYLYDDAAPRRRSQAAHTAYVKIAEGCDRPCAFCIIPKLRGPQRSRAPESVLREARDLVAGGTKEICLVAQDLTTYGTDLPGADDPEAPRLASLLRQLAAIDGLGWIRLHYAYPSACTDELLDAIGSEPRVASYLDVPIQHVDSGVLKAMRRGYGERQVRDLVARFRARVPERNLPHHVHRRPPGRDRRGLSEPVRLRARGRARPRRRLQFFARGGHRRGAARRSASRRKRSMRAAASCCGFSARSPRRSCGRCAARPSACWSRGRPTSRSTS